MLARSLVRSEVRSSSRLLVPFPLVAKVATSLAVVETVARAKRVGRIVASVIKPRSREFAKAEANQDLAFQGNERV